VAPRISIVIPARDEERYLGATLAAIERQTFRDFETLVVANACVDRTAEIARGHARVLRLDPPGICGARNLGARAAQGQLVLFLDADILLPPDALAVAAERFDSGSTIGTFEARPSGPRLWYRILFALRNLLHRSGLYRSTWGIILCPRELFLRVGGFDPERCPQENRDLTRRLLRHGRYRFLRAPVTISIRRYERWGPLRFCRFWVLTYLGSFAGRFRSGDYRPVR
jgi:glycosyltransferase involved in cell wall biosynthesis